MCNYKTLSAWAVVFGTLMAQIVGSAETNIPVRGIAQGVIGLIERRGNEIIEPVRPSADAIPIPGEINWTKQTIKAKGWGVIDTTLPNRAQAKLMARGAAIAVAQRNLLEIIKGVRVVSEVKVQDYMTKSDYIYKRIEGVIRGAQIVGEPVEKEGIVEVEMGVEFHGPTGLVPAVWPEIKPTLPNLPAITAEDKQKIKEISAVAFDLSNAGGAPAVFPRILDESGNVIFDLAWYYDPNNPDLQKLIKIWTATKEELQATGIWDNPYVIEARRAVGGDIIVGGEEVKKADWLRKCFKSLVKIGKLIWAIM